MNNNNNDNAVNTNDGGPQTKVNEQGDITNNTTQFIQEGAVTETKFESEVVMDPSMLLPQVVTEKQSIERFLARPILLREGTFDEASANILHIISLPYDLLKNTMYTPKVLGFMNFRATTHITLQMNANRFCSGRLIMYFVPQAQVTAVCALNRSVDLITKTSLPHVDLDLATDTQCTLSIPHLSPKLYYDLNTGNGPVGGVYISVYGAARVGTGSSSPTYTVWGHFTDVELEIPVVPGTFLTASGPIKGSKKTRRLDPSDVELGKNTAIGSGLSSLSTALGAIKTPFLKDILGTPAWVLGAIGKAASAFGYSNPTNEAMPSVFRRAITLFGTQSDRGNNADKLAYFATNKVMPMLTFAGSTHDEASISYIASRMAMYDSFTITDTQTYDSTLFVSDISAGTFRSEAVPVGDGTSVWNYRTYTPVGLLMQYFQYWRGSIILRFIFIKTEFHTGRIAVYFNPSPNAAQTTPTLADSNYLLRDVIDLSNTTEFLVTIPYTNNSPWMQEGEIMGRLVIKAVNPLQHPPTVSSTITVMVEVAGGDDFEIAGPGPINTQYKLHPVVVLNGAFTTQSAPIIKKGELGNAQTHPEGTLQAAYTMGEKIVSVYNIIKRYSRLMTVAGTYTQYLKVRPMEVGYMGRGYNQNEFSVSSVYSDPYSLFTSAYAYVRGSHNFRILDPNASSWNRVRMGFDDRTVRPFVDFLSSGATTSNWMHTHEVVHSAGDSAGVEVNLPHYSELPMRLVRPNSCTTDADYCPPADEYDTPYHIEVHAANSFGTTTTLWRSAGDDCQLGLFLGFPPLYDSLGEI